MSSFLLETWEATTQSSPPIRLYRSLRFQRRSCLYSQPVLVEKRQNRKIYARVMSLADTSTAHLPIVDRAGIDAGDEIFRIITRLYSGARPEVLSCACHKRTKWRHRQPEKSSVRPARGEGIFKSRDWVKTRNVAIFHINSLEQEISLLFSIFNADCLFYHLWLTKNETTHSHTAWCSIISVTN